MNTHNCRFKSVTPSNIYNQQEPPHTHTHHPLHHTNTIVQTLSAQAPGLKTCAHIYPRTDVCTRMLVTNISYAHIYAFHTIPTKTLSIFNAIDITANKNAQTALISHRPTPLTPTHAFARSVLQVIVHANTGEHAPIKIFRLKEESTAPHTRTAAVSCV